MTRPTNLDARGRLTIRPEYRRLLSGPVEQLETEEGILLRPTPDPPAKEASPAATDAEAAGRPPRADVA